MTTLIIIFICSYLAFSLSAICGGGAGLILLPVLGSLLPIGHANYALEFSYDDGFEFEQVTELTDLNEKQQQFVLSHKDDASRIIIEEVYTLHQKYHEAYFFSGSVLKKKIDFD